MLEDQWSGMVWPASKEANNDPDTGVDKKVLQDIGKASVTVPDGFVRQLFVLLYCGNFTWTFLALGNPPEVTASCKASSSKCRFGKRT